MAGQRGCGREKCPKRVVKPRQAAGPPTAPADAAAVLPAAQPHEPPAWALAKLSKYAAQTVELLHDLTDIREVQEQHVWPYVAEEDTVVRLGPMPTSAVAHADVSVCRERRLGCQ